MTQNPPLVFWKNADDEVRSDGVEVAINGTPMERIQGFVNYTYNRVERWPAQTSVNYGGPQHLANVGVTYLSTSASANIVVRYGGKVKGIQAEGGKPTELDRWIIVDLGGSRQVVTGLDAFLRVSNLFDTTYETFDGRPMFGRAVVGGLTVRL
jgi:outer membrane receptor protein involved in Fe transport